MQSDREVGEHDGPHKCQEGCQGGRRNARPPGRAAIEVGDADYNAALFMTERAMAMAEQAIATAMKRARARAARGMAKATKKAMATAARLMATATKRARARAERGMATVTRVAGDKKGDDEGS